MNIIFVSMQPWWKFPNWELGTLNIAEFLMNNEFFASRCFTSDNRFYFYGLLCYNFLSKVLYSWDLPNTGTVCSQRLPTRHYADKGCCMDRLCRRLWFFNGFNMCLSQKQIYQYFRLDLPNLWLPFKYIISQ